ncbi:putative QCR2-40 kDa ubiquinol cytochrome-c reductase core protein 2 [Ceraceosorus guamensis]|uniref:Cytochrome b-c1 complex subunit 2, mitochondrial n=1 Tax=Ceraceosorus guamensis TaxID=1522189 RepID=A0A316W2R2_9BASI|nr:putative QCR2-40 kDa ubiquinol cytochrome-c reductase core protein 2 [Ceraceosorus guamensis]PWN44070.1 putative QCR2-40 kDa ubiquinol cytochrome-c reductase core protein 2 [Ceraceosorus guamensis]
MSVVSRSTASLRAARAPLSLSTSRRSFTTANADGIRVAAADDGAQTAAITVALNAGPRFESSPGAAHALKTFAFKSTEKRSALALIRETELYGGALSATLSKEHLFLTAEFLRGDEEFFVEILGEVLGKSSFLRHEYDEVVVPSLSDEYQINQSTPAALALEDFTQTAYRQRGLGASLYATPVSPLSYDTVTSYAKAAFAKSNLAVLGTGIDASKLSSLVGKHFKSISAGSALSPAPSKYFGGENRIAYLPPHGSDFPRAHDAHLVLGFEGAPLGSPELAVLRAHLGGQASVKWNDGLSALSKISASNSTISANAFNLGYSEAGLFGVQLSAPHAKIAEVAKAAAQAIKASADSLSSEELARAVAKAKFETASALENRAGVHTLAGSHLLSGSPVTTLEEVFSKLEGVNASAVSSAAGKLLKSKPTVVAVGDVHKLPYADELL